MPNPEDSFRHGSLYKLLSAKMPDRFKYQPGYRFAGEINVGVLAVTLGRSREGCYKWFRADRLSSHGARAIIALSDGQLEREDLLEFVI